MEEPKKPRRKFNFEETADYQPVERVLSEEEQIYWDGVAEEMRKNYDEYKRKRDFNIEADVKSRREEEYRLHLAGFNESIQVRLILCGLLIYAASVNHNGSFYIIMRMVAVVLSLVCAFTSLKVVDRCFFFASMIVFAVVFGLERFYWQMIDFAIVLTVSAIIYRDYRRLGLIKRSGGEI